MKIKHQLALRKIINDLATEQYNENEAYSEKIKSNVVKCVDFFEIEKELIAEVKAQVKNARF